MESKPILFRAAAAIAGVIAAGVLAGCMTTGAGTVVQDPQGRFRYQAAPQLKPQSGESAYDRYTLESPAMEVFVLAVQAPSEQAGKALAFERIGRDAASLKLDGTASFGEWRADAFRAGSGSQWAGLAYQYRGDTLYAMIVYGGGDSSPDSLPVPVASIIGSFQFTAAAGQVFRPVSLADFEDYIRRVAASTGGSLSVAAVRNGRLVYRYAAGDRGRGQPASPEVAYHWGSISKIVTAAALLQQVEQGRVALDAPLNVWFPEFALGKRITVRQLLTHSAGLPSFEDTHLVAFGANRMPELASVLEAYWSRVNALAYEPGSASVYHNWNFLVLARLVEKASGEEFTSYVRRHLFAPAVLEHTVYTTAELAGALEALAVVGTELLASTEAKLAAAGLDTERVIAYRSGATAHLLPFDILPCWAGVKGTAADAARFGWLFLNGGRGEAHNVLKKPTVAQMMRMQKSTEGRPLGMGLAWQLGRQGKESFVEHPGGAAGIDCLLRLYPDRRLSIVVLANARGSEPGRVAEHLAELLAPAK
jgi:CubicO group peptidase (beta-lactamase class C family)